MNPHFILVRHAAPNIIEDVPPVRWTLSEEGRRAAATLADRLAEYQPAAVVSSPEPKAFETASILAKRLRRAVTKDESFVEHRRPGLRFGTREEFEANIRAIFERPSERLFGGESADEAFKRFEDALSRHTARPLIVATHGTVLTLFVSRKTGLDPFELWSSMKLPEAFVLDEKLRLMAR